MHSFLSKVDKVAHPAVSKNLMPNFDVWLFLWYNEFIFRDKLVSVMYAHQGANLAFSFECEGYFCSPMLEYFNLQGD
ncbi:hypothetical protein FWH30_00390 [Microgenomates group bacterium]|nr:hypothetical protein [Microgenomates group bacterium]